ncbi:hypothetical protein EJB05_27994, partial [Eragrostis curvula]
MGLMKINLDAAISKNSGKAAVAAVARNSAGLFLGTSVVVTIGLTEPELMEALALREGLALATVLGLRYLRVTSDNVNVIKNIERASQGPYGRIVQKITASCVMAYASPEHSEQRGGLGPSRVSAALMPRLGDLRTRARLWFSRGEDKELQMVMEFRLPAEAQNLFLAAVERLLEGY